MISVKGLFILVGFVLLFITVAFVASLRIDDNMRQIIKENQILKKQRDSLQQNIDILENKKDKADEAIHILDSINNNQLNNVHKLDSQINKIKKGYDKASHHADNFASSDIQRYFADSIK
jgi:seryl-tRNA synthetase